MEVATAWRMEWRRDFALDWRKDPAAIRNGGDLVEERHRVGMIWLSEKGIRRRTLDDAAEIHDRDAVADMLHHTEIVADEEIGQAEITFEFQEQIDDLRLNRDVERRDRFIADDELRVDRERPRNPDPLPLTAGKLVRIPAAKGWIQADPLHHGRHIRILLAPRDDAVGDRRLANDVDHLLARIERGHWILEDHLRSKARGAPCSGRKCPPVLPLPEDLTVTRQHDAC